MSTNTEELPIKKNKSTRTGLFLNDKNTLAKIEEIMRIKKLTKVTQRAPDAVRDAIDMALDYWKKKEKDIISKI